MIQNNNNINDYAIECITDIKIKYNNMIQRCTNPKNKLYKWYGGNGIKVCEYWTNHFNAFLLWALKNGYTKGLEIDRINNALGYSPSNCRFVTRQQQLENRFPVRANKHGQLAFNKKHKIPFNVLFHPKSKNKYQVLFKRNKVIYNVGFFATIPEAVKARDKALATFEQFGKI